MSSTLSQPATTSRLIAGPFNRVEGDLEITLDIEEGRVSAAYANSPLFRGFEQILLGKDPRDALTITPRICGICSISQSAAAARALADASGLVSTEAGQTAAALIHAVENLADHLTHFYLFFMPDFAKPIYADRPWHGQALDRVAGSAGGQGSSRALQARAELLHIMGLLAGKWPHTLALQPGGVTKTPNTSDLVRLHSILRGFRRFLETEMIGGPLEAFAALETHKALEHWHHNEPGGGDLRLFLTIAEDLALHKAGMGPDRFLSFGAYPRSDGPLFAQGLWRTGSLHEVPFDAIEEHIGYSWMTGTGPLHPFAGETHPDPAMADPAYSWCKAPRLVGRSVEVGAIARQIVDGHPLALDLARNGASVHSRVVGRVLEIARTVLALEGWISGLRPEDHYIRRGNPLKDGRGMGLVEAARGSLGHWLEAKGGKLTRYQIIAPTTWNFSPRDDFGQPGPVEQALVGAEVRPGEEAPIAVQHIVRSFDPCMVCTVH